MKKLVSLLVVAAFLVAFMVPAFAANGINNYEKKLIEYVDTAYTIEDGKVITVPKEYFTALDNVFPKVDVSKEQYDQIIKILDEALEYVRANNLREVDDIWKTGSTQKLLDYAYRVYDILGCRLETKGHITDRDHGLLIMYGPDGEKIAEVNPKVIIKTGADYSSALALGLAAAAVLVAAGVSAKRFRRKSDEV